MKNLKEIPLPGEPDKAFSYEGALYRVRVTNQRAVAATKFIITVAALNKDNTVHQTSSGFTITDPHVHTYMDCTKSDLASTIEAVVVDKIKECKRCVENQHAADTYMKKWGK